MNNEGTHDVLQREGESDISQQNNDFKSKVNQTVKELHTPARKK